MITKNFKKLIVLSSVCLMSSIAFATTSCQAKNNFETLKYTILTQDGTNVKTILDENKIEYDENELSSFRSTNSNIAYTLSNGDIIANNVGTTTIEIFNSNKTNLYSIELTVEECQKIPDDQKVSFVHSRATIKDTLEDIVYGESNLAKHEKYQIGVKVPNQTDQTLTVLSSNEDVITTIEENGNYYLYTQNVGQSNITIYDCQLNKMVDYTVNVVKKMESDEEVRDYLTRIDYFQGWGWDSGNIHGGEDVAMKLSFPTSNSGILYGNSGELGNVGQNNFEIKFVQYGATKDSNDELFGYAESYRYQIENFQPAIQFPYTIKYLDVSETKDQLRLYSTNILLDFFFPKSN